MKIYCLPALLLIFYAFYGCKKTDTDDAEPVIVKPSFSNSKVYYVSTTGDDSRTSVQAKNPATPWKTIQKAANTITACDTVVIDGGTYFEKVSLPPTCNGTAAASTLFKNKDGESVILDGGGGGVIWEGLFNLIDNSFITVRGIKTQNVYWYGFNIGNSSHIKLDSCASFNTGASGIYCARGTAITLNKNNVRKACQRPFREPNGNGTQECITLGATNNFIVTNNEVWDSAIPGDAGGEGIDAKGGCFNGEISNNYIHDIITLGIYVDAGSGEEYNIRVFSNKLVRTGGMSVAGELGGHARDVYFYNNIIKESKGSGFVFQSIGNGKYTNIYIVNNTFFNNASAGNFVGELGNYSNNTGNANIRISNNIFYNSGTNYKFSIWHNLAAPHVITNNLYFTFKPGNNGPNSFNAARLTAADVKDLDPLFVNSSTDNFSLQPLSPAVNKGLPITLPPLGTFLFTTDFNGKQRGTTGWDMGAFEL